MKAKIFNSYTYFLFGLVLVTVASFVPVPCPACGGTGIIEGTTGISVKDIEAELVSHYELGMDCGWDFENYTYDVTLTVENWTSTESYGIILVTFHDPDASYTLTVEEEDEEVDIEVRGATLLSYPVYVELEPRSEKVIEKRMKFEGVTLEFFGNKDHLIEANLASQFACPFHEEKATVTFPEWLRLRLIQ